MAVAGAPLRAGESLPGLFECRHPAGKARQFALSIAISGTPSLSSSPQEFPGMAGIPASTL
jgi:hypothetical protein